MGRLGGWTLEGHGWGWAWAQSGRVVGQRWGGHSYLTGWVCYKGVESSIGNKGAV